jgi:hypothetical protein
MQFIKDLKRILAPDVALPEVDASGNIVPTSSEQDLKIGVVTCPSCSHEFVKYTDERELGVKGGDGIPYRLLVQIVGSFLIGYVLYQCNMYLLPDDSFSNPLSVIYSVLLIIPSMVLFLALFAVLYMGLIYIWFYMALTVSGVGLVVLLGALFVEFARRWML